jgi:anti-sigma factor RsiW
MQTLHLTEDFIEQYAMGKLPESQAADAEEHLLVCQKCRDHVELIGLIIAGLREESIRPAGDGG